jgi:hypothetical protein
MYTMCTIPIYDTWQKLYGDRILQDNIPDNIKIFLFITFKVTIVLI